MEFTHLTKRQNEESIAPETVDISLTGRCQLDCAWCWGEKHTIGVNHEADDWNNLLNNFSSEGTSHVVFTGGEPLMVPFLPDVAKHAKNIGLRTTLSTNGILLPKRHKSIMPHIDDLGLPLDGPTSGVNKNMRKGRIDNFLKVIESAMLVQEEYPDTSLTVRTVIARPNINSVPDIPEVLEQEGVDLSRLRYKMYQVEPIGPRATETATDYWMVDEAECLEVANQISQRYPNLQHTLQLYRNTSGRYYQIMPQGNAYGTYIDSKGTPHMVELGNPMTDFRNALGMIATRYACLY